MNSPVDKIKERLSIEEIVSSYIKLDRAGNNLKARCPFHNEKTPSFFISPDRGSYYCFGCGASGDIFTFVEEFEGLDFKGALKLLAEKAGVPLTAYSKENKEAESEKEKLYRIMEEATLFFEKNLGENKVAFDYLKKRGLEDKTIKDFRIGYAILDWRKLYDYLRLKNFSDNEIERAGLTKRPDDKNKAMYDRFRGRIMFPLCDSSGRVVAFSGRILEDDGKSAKYLNSPDTPIFKKSSILFGLDKAKLSIKKNDFSIVVEGQFDLILSHQAGFRNTVATSGTALVDGDKGENNTINNLGMISRLSQNIVFIFDSDKAGFNASIRATPIAMALFSDMNVKASAVPDGKDPADLIKEKGPDAWREVIRNAKHIIEFLVDKYISINENKDKLKVKLEIDEKIIPYIALINNPVKRSHFVSLVADKTGISEDDIRAKIKKVEQNMKNEKIETGEITEIPNVLSKKDYIKRKILGIIFWQKSLKEQSVEVEKVLKQFAEILKSTEGEILQKEKNNEKDLIFEAEVFYENGADLKKDVLEMLENLEKESLKEELETKMRELHKAEENKNKEKAVEILKEISEINRKMQDIKNGR
ncbi:DNA primase [Candidatus Nomurabacteria bacterium]|nr:DNA primase [Candidatus Nomurabacteria bacterium]